MEAANDETERQQRPKLMNSFFSSYINSGLEFDGHFLQFCIHLQPLRGYSGRANVISRTRVVNGRWDGLKDRPLRLIPGLQITQQPLKRLVIRVMVFPLAEIADVPCPPEQRRPCGVALL